MLTLYLLCVSGSDEELLIPKENETNESDFVHYITADISLHHFTHISYVPNIL